MSKNQKFCLNRTLRFFYVITWRQPLSAEIHLQACDLHTEFDQLCTFYYLWHDSEIFSDYSSSLDATILLWKWKKNLLNPVKLIFKVSHWNRKCAAAVKYLSSKNGLIQFCRVLLSCSAQMKMISTILACATDDFQKISKNAIFQSAWHHFKRFVFFHVGYTCL